MYVNSSPWPIIINKKVISSRCMHRSAHVRYSAWAGGIGAETSANEAHGPPARVWSEGGPTVKARVALTVRHFLSLASFDRVSGARHVSQGGSVTLVITAAVPTVRRR